MGKLGSFKDLESKKQAFNGSDVTYYKIDHAQQFVEWYKKMHELSLRNTYGTFFRGMNEARYKLYNSAQRYWIQNNLTELESLKEHIPYIRMIQNMVDKAKEHKLLQQVFEYYDIIEKQMDFPILSILQHYTAPTPLMDWTYNPDIALFFAIENIERSEDGNAIENYISIYHIDKDVHKGFVMNNLNYISANIFPSVSGLSNWLGQDKVVYISDFEISQFEIKPTPTLGERKIKPLTTYFNLNILAQKGIFIFNPNESTPLEEFAKSFLAPNDEKPDDRIFCYNINKDLVELIKLKIGKNGIDTSFIYPDLKNFCRGVLSEYLKFIVNE